MDVLYLLGGSFAVGFLAFSAVTAFKASRRKPAVAVPKEEPLILAGDVPPEFQAAASRMENVVVQSEPEPTKQEEDKPKFVDPKFGLHEYPPPFPNGFLQLEHGVNKIRLLPPVKGHPFFVARRQHYNLEDRKNSVVQCNKEKESGKDWKGNCPICDAWKALWKEAQAAEEKGNWQRANELSSQARQIKPVERYYYNAIARDRGTGQPQILAVPKAIHQEIVRIVIGDEEQGEEGYGDISDVHTGRDIKIIKETLGRSQWPRYTVMPVYKESVISESVEAANEFLTTLWNLEAAAHSWEKDQSIIQRVAARVMARSNVQQRENDAELCDEEFLAELNNLSANYLQ